MLSQSLELVLSVENDSLCSMPILNTKTDWLGHFRLPRPEWEGNTIFRAVLSYLGLLWSQSLLFWKVPIVLLQSLSVPGVSGHACALLVRHAEVCVLQILFCSFTQWDWLWPSLVLGLRIAEAGWVLRLLYFSAQSSRRLHLTLSLPTFLGTN